MSLASRTADFFVAGGTLRPNTPSYVERPADDELFELALAGEFCYVLTPRQMGKSSLMIRTAQRLQKRGIHTVMIDLTVIGLVKIDAWYLGLLTELTRALHLPVNPETWWQERAALGQVQRFTNFLRDVVLTETEGQVVIFIDEIDSTLNLDFRDDFFAAIRAMYNARARETEFDRLTFILLGVASPPDLIKDRTRTPFNIGQAITLQDFSQTDAAVLQAGLETIYPSQGKAIFSRIYYWTNGHPYLTQKLCQAVTTTNDRPWTDKRIDGLVEKLFLTKEVRKEANLKFVRDTILNHPQQRQMLKTYRKVYKGKNIANDEQSPAQNQLNLSGLVKAIDGYLQIRNEIYRHTFNSAWIRQNTAINWAPIVASIAIFVAVLAVSSIIYNNWVQNQVNGAVTHFLYETSEPKDRLADLAKIFRLQGIFEPRDHGYRAKELFYSLSRQEQLALFNIYDIEASSDLIVVIKGLYITLADVDDTGSTDPLLEAMVKALDYLDETEETEKLKGEINSWLGGRDLARQDQYTVALTKYDEAIAYNGENPATLYERAKILIELSQYQQALSDLDQVIAIARQVPAPTPTPSSPTISPTPSSTLTSTSTSTHGTNITPTGTPSSTSLPTLTETPTPIPVSIISKFTNTGEMVSAVRNLIDGSPELISFLAGASDLEYTNLRESGLLVSLSNIIGQSDAVVTSDGVVLLRSGPGIDYDSLATLSDGTTLDILRRVHNKDDWIKVAVNPNSNERLEGYVNIASGYIEINVELPDLPPIYEFGPALSEPRRFESRSTGDFITFKWSDYGALEEDQYYSLIIVRDDLEDEAACYHWQTKDTEMIIRPEDYENCTAGAYHWGVGIATKMFNEDGTPMLDKDGKQVWRDDSERDERFPLDLGISHPDAPPE